MAAEWTYFVAREPPHIAVVVHEKNWTDELLESGKEFSVTLASAEQADVADFVGGFSGREVDKSNTSGLRLAEPSVTGIPWVTGGLSAFECTAVTTVPLPHYRMVIGEVVAEHPTTPTPKPLVKHGGMYHLGEAVERVSVVAAASVRTGGHTLRVCATGPVDGDPPYEVRVDAGEGSSSVTGHHPCDEYGDLQAEIDISNISYDAGLTVLVSRPGLKSATVQLAADSRQH